MSISEECEGQYQTFRDYIFTAITEKLDISPNDTGTPSKRRKSKRKKSINETTTTDKPSSLTDLDASTSPSTLADFSDYLASEIFLSLPAPLQTLSPQSELISDYTLPLTLSTIESINSHLPPSTTDTLTSYSLITPPVSDIQSFLSPILTSYIRTLTTPPPPPSTTRPKSNTCELCARTHLPLTYHHLIPRSTHAKALKRKWYAESELSSVAWLCRACHSFVHRMAGNDELAREWFTIERIKEREGTQEWISWIEGVRWKKR